MPDLQNLYITPTFPCNKVCIISSLYLSRCI